MQLMPRSQRSLELFLQRNSGPVLLLVVLFVVGVIFGALAVRSLEPTDKQEVVTYLSTTLGSLERPPAGAGTVLLKQSLMGSLKLLALLWVLGITVVGAVGVMLLALLRGLLTGFVVAFLASELGGSGILVAIAGHLPHSLLEVPALILAGAASISFSRQVIRSWRERRRVPNFYPALASYTRTILSIGVLLLGASLIKAFLSPALVHLVSGQVRG